MRDIFLTIVFFGAILFVFKRPYVGIWIWSWMSYMSPYRLAYGFAYSFPFVQIIAIVTIISTLFSKEKKSIPWTPVTVILSLFVIWTCVTTFFAIFPDVAQEEWVRFMKIQIMIFMTLMLIRTREQIHWLIWVIAFSIGFYGIKGGIFAVMTGGAHHVLGPARTFISNTNELALALVMVLPLMRYIQLNLEKKWAKMALTGSMGLCAIAILSTYSRGGFLALAAMGLFLFFKSRKKAVLGLSLALIIPLLITFMPQQWSERMSTIQTFEEDASARGRINAWWFAYNLSLDMPLMGGGFRVFQPQLFPLYAPNPDDYHDSHSIYFEVLAEQGYIGLLFFLLFLYLGFRTGGWIIKQARNDVDLMWARDLASMIQVSLIGYFVGGLVTGMAFFDLPYQLIVILVVLRRLIEHQKDVAPVEN